MTGSSHTGDHAVDPNAETPVPADEPARPATVDAYVLSGSYPSIAEASAPVVAEFSIDQIVPRAEPATREFTSSEIFLRLEQTIYGPLSRERLAELLASGRLTGFEQASSNLRTWTPLIYHPRMVLSEDVDPETTHRMLQTESNLPKESAVQRRIDLAHYGEQALAPTEEVPAQPALATPLAKMLIRPRKRSSATHNAEPTPSLDLPVFGDLGQETLESLAQRAAAPNAGTLMMPAFAALAEVASGPSPATESAAITVPNPAVAPIAPPGPAVPAFPEAAAPALQRDRFREMGNELPTLQVPATDGAGAVAFADPLLDQPPTPDPEAVAPAAVPARRGGTESAGGAAMFALALAVAAVAIAAAVYFYLRVATLEREIRALEQSLPAQQR